MRSIFNAVANVEGDKSYYKRNQKSIYMQLPAGNRATEVCTLQGLRWIVKARRACVQFQLNVQSAAHIQCIIVVSLPLPLSSSLLFVFISTFKTTIEDDFLLSELLCSNYKCFSFRRNILVGPVKFVLFFYLSFEPNFSTAELHSNGECRISIDFPDIEWE